MRVVLIPILGHRFPDAAASADTAKIIVPRRSTKAHTAIRRLRKSVAITSSLQMIGKGAWLKFTKSFFPKLPVQVPVDPGTEE